MRGLAKICELSEQAAIPAVDAHKGAMDLRLFSADTFLTDFNAPTINCLNIWTRAGPESLALPFYHDQAGCIGMMNDGED